MVTDLNTGDSGVYRRGVQRRIESVNAVGAESILLSETEADNWSVFRLTSAAFTTTTRQPNTPRIERPIQSP